MHYEKQINSFFRMIKIREYFSLPDWQEIRSIKATPSPGKFVGKTGSAEDSLKPDNPAGEEFGCVCQKL